MARAEGDKDRRPPIKAPRDLVEEFKGASIVSGESVEDTKKKTATLVSRMTQRGASTDEPEYTVEEPKFTVEEPQYTVEEPPKAVAPAEGWDFSVQEPGRTFMDDWQRNRPDWGTVFPGQTSIAGAALGEVMAPISAAWHELLGFGTDLVTKQPLGTSGPQDGHELINRISPYTPEKLGYEPGDPWVKPRQLGNLFRDIAALGIENVPYLLAGRVGRSGEVVKPLPGEAPKIIDQAALDQLVAERKEVRAAYPDAVSAPPEPVAPTGTIVDPELAAGVHTERSKYPKVPEPYTVRPGEFGEVTPESYVTPEGEVASTLSDEERLMRAGAVKKPDTGKPYPVQPLGKVSGSLQDTTGQLELLRPDAGGRKVIEPGDQIDIFDVPIRQRLHFRIPKEPVDPLSLEGSYEAQYQRYLKGNEGKLPTGERVPPRYDPVKDRPVPKMPLTDYRFSDKEFADILSKPYDPAKPIDVQVSKSGLSASVSEDHGFVVPEYDLDDIVPTEGKLPGVYDRWFKDTLSAMERSGPAGAKGAEMIRHSMARAGIQTSTEMGEVERGLDEIFGQSGWWRRKGVALKQWKAGENAAIHGSRRRWNITEAEYESLYNTLYTEGRIAPINEKVARAARLIYEKGTFPASADPAVQSLTIDNPFTGKAEPMGSPSMFMPQRPIKQITADAISNRHWNIIYERMGGQEGLGVDFKTFQKNVIAFSRRDPEVAAFKMKGLQTKRLLDLEALGGSPYQWAKKLGYDTDFYRNTYSFNRLAHLRGRFAEIEKQLEQVASKSGEGEAWVREAAEAAMLNNQKWDMLSFNKKIIRGISEATDITMLQSGILGNTTQLIYPIARAGVRRSAEGMFDMLTGKDHLIIQNSGALLPQTLNDMVVPQGPLARWSSAAFKGFGISKIDRGTRWFAGHIGNAFINGLEKSLLENPNRLHVAKQLDELGGDAKVILQQGKIPDNMRYEMIQNFANNTAGVTDVRGVPLYATSENPLFRLVNKYRTFAQANFAEINRLVNDAPNGLIAARRITELLVGAQVAGAGINALREKISDALMGPNKNPSKSYVRWVAENEVLGLGALPGMLIVQASQQGTAQFAANVIGGPSVGRAIGFMDDIKSTFQNGVGWRTIDTASRSLPVPFSPMFLGPYVKGKVRREAKNTAERKREMNDDGED